MNTQQHYTNTLQTGKVFTTTQQQLNSSHHSKCFFSTVLDHWVCIGIFRSFGENAEDWNVGGRLKKSLQEFYGILNRLWEGLLSCWRHKEEYWHTKVCPGTSCCDVWWRLLLVHVKCTTTGSAWPWHVQCVQGWDCSHGTECREVEMSSYSASQAHA